MSANVKIPEDVLTVLASGRVEGGRFYYPEGSPLDRDVFKRVDKTLKQIGGGGWKGGKVAAHVFEREVEGLIEGALLTGEFTDEKREFQFFETQRAEAERMVERADLRPGLSIKEPHGGRGALARVIRELMPLGCTLCVGEINPQMRAELERQGFNMTGDDFLLSRGLFDRIIQNPPFSNRQDARHVLHAFDCLAPGGRLVSVMSAGIKFRKDGEYERVRELVARRQGSVEDLPRGVFKASGAVVSTVLVTIQK